jgi:acetyl-CoA C-acetyltransferase
MTHAVIVSACRTPIGRFNGGLSKFRSPELGAMAIKEAMARANLDPADVDEVIMGTVLQAGLGQNPARQAALGAGVPPEVGSYTVNKVCGSGLKSVMLAAQAIRAGDADVIVAGGQESMTNAPYLMPQARNGMRLGHGKLLDAMVHDGLWEIYNDYHMGETGELIAERCDVSRADMDAFAAESHRRAHAATESGAFADEIVPVEVKDRKGNVTVVGADEGIRADVTADSLGKLRAAFRKDGKVTPGNASQISDGASALVVMSEKAAAERGLEPLATITGYATGGTDPKWVMYAPVVAMENLKRRTGNETSSYDLVELNEAFASAACAVTKEAGLDAARTNVNGGAVALGHPIGASGARILTTLLYAMKARDVKTGMASLCLGGGNAVALSVQR